MNVVGYMRTHRPARVERERFQQLPVALLNRTLGQVEEDCAFATPSASDTEFASKLMIAMSGSFANEAARREMFWYMIREEFPTILFERYRDEGLETDGSAQIPVRQGLALGINLEVKLDIGAGHGDPRLQNCAHAALYYCSGRRDLLRACSRCPTLLMELSGPNLSLSGFAFGQYFCCDQLSQTVSLLWQPKSEVMIGAPRLVFAMRRAWPALQELDKQPVPDQWQLTFPCPCSYLSLRGLQRHGFKYLERLTNYTFHAVPDGPAAGSHLPSTEPELFIKFCKNYSTEAHEALHKTGFAPRLLGCELLPGRWLMVVMEYLPSARIWDDVDPMEKPRDALRAALGALHDAGFVHGDLRGCNVLVDKERVYATDLEWAGKVGEAKYPIFMNHDIDWPPDAGDNKPITKEHFAEMVRMMCIISAGPAAWWRGWAGDCGNSRRPARAHACICAWVV
ncbi:g2189 [Coccomyxa elongata]